MPVFCQLCGDTKTLTFVYNSQTIEFQSVTKKLQKAPKKSSEKVYADKQYNQNSFLEICAKKTEVY